MEARKRVGETGVRGMERAIDEVLNMHAALAEDAIQRNGGPQRVLRRTHTRTKWQKIVHEFMKACSSLGSCDNCGKASRKAYLEEYTKIFITASENDSKMSRGIINVGSADAEDEEDDEEEEGEMSKEEKKAKKKRRLYAPCPSAGADGRANECGLLERGTKRSVGA